MSRLSVTQCTVMESCDARARPGEAQVEVVDGLEEHRGRGVDVGAPLAQEVDVADGVLAREARDAAGAPHPARQLGGGVALDVEGAAHGLAHGVGAPGVHPDDGRADGAPRVVDGNRARPLRGAPDTDDPLGRHAAVGQRPAGRRHDGVPPGLRGLLGPAVLGQVDPDRLEGVGHDPPGGRQDGHLGPPRPEVDRQDVGRLGARGLDGAERGGRHGAQAARRWRGHGGEAYRAAPARSRAGHRCEVSRPGRPRPRPRSRPCCPPRRCRRAASG